MIAEELPLILFTLLTQLATGMFILLTITRQVLAGRDNSLAIQATDKGIILVGPLVVAAMISSSFHLGFPLNAPKAILNIGTSWLSREILFTNLFLGLWFATVICYKKNQIGAGKLLGWLGCLAGLGTVISTATSYVITIKPAWENINTYISFLGTILLLGVAGTMLVIAWGLKDQVAENMTRLSKNMGWLAVAAVVIPLLYTLLFVSQLQSAGGAAAVSASLLTENYMVLNIMRWALLITAVVVLQYVLYKRLPGASRFGELSPLLWSVFVLVLASESIGRYIFYAIGVSTGIGL